MKTQPATLPTTFTPHTVAPAYTSETGVLTPTELAEQAEARREEHALLVGIMISAPTKRPMRLCSNKVPEAHQVGEFPMDCYPCHVHADS